MTRTILPTPTLTAFFAGRAVQPIGFHPITGRPVYPIAGGAEDGGTGGNGGSEGGDGAGGGDESGTVGPGGSQGSNQSGNSKGYPDNTRVEDMQPAEAAAYWQAQARKHEGRNRDLLKVTGGKYGDDLKAQLDELEKLRDSQRTDGEKAVEEAKNQTRAEVRQEFGTKLAAAEFRAALAHVDEGRRDQIIEGINLSNYLTSDGDVDADKVKSYAATIAPADKGTGSGGANYGAGRRSQQTETGVKSGRDLYAQRHKSTTTTS